MYNNYADIEQVSLKDVRNNDILLSFDKDDDIIIQKHIQGCTALVSLLEKDLACRIWYDEGNDDYEGTQKTLNDFIHYVRARKELCENLLPYLTLSRQIIVGKWTGDAWIIYDLYDEVNKHWFHPSSVRYFCEEYDLKYEEEIYNNKFNSLDNIINFMNTINFKENETGIIIKNISRLNNNNNNLSENQPAYIIIEKDMKI